MIRSRELMICSGLIGATCVWFAVSWADEDLAISQPDRIAQLTARLETLEKRIAVLETDKEQATRRADASSDDSPDAVRPAPLDRRKNKEAVRIWMHLRNGSAE